MMPEYVLDNLHANMICSYAEMEEAGYLEIVVDRPDLIVGEPDPIGLGTRLTDEGRAELLRVAPTADPEVAGATALLALRFTERRAKELRDSVTRLRRELADAERDKRHLEKIEKALEKEAARRTE